VLDVVGLEQLAQRVVLDVDERVVGLQPLGRDRETGVELEGALDERGDGRRFLVWVDLGVGQASVVVDDRVAELPADA
jgi:hypothetical protein